MNARGVEPAAPSPLSDFIALNEELAALVRARLPLEPHLARFAAELPGRRQLAQRIAGRLEGGESLAAAVEAESARLPAVYRAVLVAGAESGELASALESIVDTASRLDYLRRVTGVALIYPLVVVVIACLLAGLVIGAIAPEFDWLYQRHYGPLARLAGSLPAVLVISVGVPCVVLLAAAIWWWRSRRVGGARTVRLGPLAWLPGVGRTHYWGQAATLADLLRLLVERGVPLPRALRLAGAAVENRTLSAAVAALAERAERGETLQSPPTAEHARQPAGAQLPLLIRLAIHHSAERPLLEASLRRAAAVYRERAIAGAEWHAEYVPALLTMMIGGSVSIAFTLLVIWPYASMLHEVAGASWR